MFTSRFRVNHILAVRYPCSRSAAVAISSEDRVRCACAGPCDRTTLGALTKKFTHEAGFVSVNSGGPLNFSVNCLVVQAIDLAIQYPVLVCQPFSFLTVAGDL